MYKEYIKYSYIFIFLILFCAGCTRRSATTVMNDKPVLLKGNQSDDYICEKTVSRTNGDLDNDGNIEVASITYLRNENGHPMDGDIIISRRNGENLKTIWRQKNLNPWKLEIADVDGDGKSEVIAGVWKKSPKDPVMAKRVFVYTWNGNRLMPKWLGSKLSRRFTDFIFSDINNDGWDELFALEDASGGKHRVAAYRWRVFGFDWLGCSEGLLDAKGIGADSDGIYVIINSSRINVQFENNRLVVNKNKR